MTLLVYYHFNNNINGFYFQFTEAELKVKKSGKALN